MDNRNDSFTRKFSDALNYLGNNSIHDLVSIKYRNSANYEDYSALIDGLLNEMNLEAKQVQGDFQGKAWLVSDNLKNKALLVEHETGLEILYIAGSIASLISLIPLINAVWKYVVSKPLISARYRENEIGIEIRIIDSKGQLLEQCVLRIEDYILSESMKETAALRVRMEKLEQELKETKENMAKKSNSKKTTRSAQKSKK